MKHTSFYDHAPPLERVLSESSLYFCKAGLMFGGRPIASYSGTAFGIDRGNGLPRARMEAMLAIGFRKALPVRGLDAIDAAAVYARRGDFASANIRLAMAHLSFCPEADAIALRLKMADDLLSSGMAPATLLKELGLGSSGGLARTYDPNQPRNPAGSGPESGRWTAGSIAAEAAPHAPPPVPPVADHSDENQARVQLAALGDFPPPPPGYDPNTWTQTLTSKGKVMLRDPAGNTYVVHVEDEGHWRHWDVRGPGGDDKGNWPPNSNMPRENQKRPPYNGQVLSDPSGDAKPWTPPKNHYVAPFPEFEPILPGIRVPLIEGPFILGVP